MMSKDPITDPGKKSKEGFLTVEKAEDGGLNVVAAETLEAYTKNCEKSILKPHYDGGALVRFDSLREMRARVAEGDTRKRKREAEGGCASGFRRVGRFG